MFQYLPGNTPKFPTMIKIPSVIQTYIRESIFSSFLTICTDTNTLTFTTVLHSCNSNLEANHREIGCKTFILYIAVCEKSHGRKCTFENYSFKREKAWPYYLHTIIYKLYRVKYITFFTPWFLYVPSRHNGID